LALVGFEGLDRCTPHLAADTADQLVAKVKFLTWTEDNLLRQVVWLR
jgi:hypothetical protein